MSATPLIFICTCHETLSRTLPARALQEGIAARFPQARIRFVPSLCRASDLDRIIEMLQDHPRAPVLFAACSPFAKGRAILEGIHVGQAFQPAVLTDLVDIREGCAWIHSTDPKAASEKAVDLICMKLAGLLHRGRSSRPPAEIENRVLVVGAGPAGMAAAGTLAGLGVPVTLVDRLGRPGGLLNQIGRLFPTNMDTRDFLAPLLKEISLSSVDFLAKSSVTRIEGDPGKFTVHMKREGQDTTLTAGAVILACGAMPVLPENRFRSGELTGVVSQLELETRLRKLEAENRPLPPPVDLKPVGRAFQPAEDWQAEKPAPHGSNQDVKSTALPPPLPQGGESVAWSTPAAKSPDRGSAGIADAVFIQCMAARDDDHPYCSSICCPTALKNGLRLKKLDPDTNVTVLHRGIMAPGRALEELYRKAMAAGVKFISFAPAEPPEVQGNGRAVSVNVTDALSGRKIDLPADLVVLSTPLKPRPETSALARDLGVRQDNLGFACGYEPMQPLTTPVPGVYLCGAVRWPVYAEQAVDQGRAAAAKAASFIRHWADPELDPAALSLPGPQPGICSVRINACSRCGQCIAVCPYGACRRGDGGTAHVLGLRCRGCGLCTAVCPSGAARIPEHNQALRAMLREIAPRV